MSEKAEIPAESGELQDAEMNTNADLTSAPLVEEGEVQTQPSSQLVTAAPPRISSAVVVANAGSTGAEMNASSKKRSADGDLLEEKPEVKRRNQRLFGALLGTLKKFKQEEAQTQNSEVAQRRAAVVQATERKTAEAAAQARQRREEELANRKEQSYAEELNRLEMSYKRRIDRRELQIEAGLVKTTTPGRPILWRPRKPYEKLTPVLEAEKEATKIWKTELLAQLEKDKAALRSRYGVQADENADEEAKQDNNNVKVGRGDGSSIDGHVIKIEGCSNAEKQLDNDDNTIAVTDGNGGAEMPPNSDAGEKDGDAAGPLIEQPAGTAAGEKQGKAEDNNEDIDIG